MPLSRRKQWVRLPTDWIQEELLKGFRWAKGRGADNVAGLLVLVVLAHYADQETGIVRLTYDEIGTILQRSRAKISGGLKVLTEHGLLVRDGFGQSTYALAGFDPTRGWGKLPAQSLYKSDKGDTLRAFEDFRLRNSAELDALKLYLLLVARRGNDTNLANITYDRIQEYSGIERVRIKRAISMLVAEGLVHVERIPSSASAYGIAQGYRLVGIDSHNHMGTRGRALEAEPPL